MVVLSGVAVVNEEAGFESELAGDHWYLTPPGGGQVRDLSFVVFNRWGQVVFESNNPSACWDGKFKGKIQRSEVFVYIIKANTICGPVVRKGTVTLIQ